MKRLFRGLLIAVPLLAVVACGIFFFVLLPQFREARANMRAGVQAAAVERRDLDDILPASGVIRPAQTVNLTFEVSGTVREIAVSAGEMVQAGAVIAALDATPLEHQLEQARQALIIQQSNYNAVNSPPTEREVAQAKAALAQAEAALAQAKAQFDNQQNVIITSCANLPSLEDTLRAASEAYNNYVAAGYQFDVDFRPDPESPAGRAWRQARDQREISAANCESARRAQSGDAAVKSAEAQVAQAKAALNALLAGPTQEQKDTVAAQLAQARLNVDQAERNLKKAVLKSPVTGVVTAVNVTLGQVVGAGGQPAAIIADTTALHLDATVDENDITSVEPGMPVRFTLQGLPPDRVLNGVVERKNPFGEANQGVVAYVVRVKINDTIPLYLGMTADVQIIRQTRRDVLVVPTRAIRRAQDGTQFVVVERSDGTTVQIAVTTGITVDDVTEVNGEGLREGQAVRIGDAQTRTGSGLFGGGG